MNRDEALELLNQVRTEQWRRHDTHSGYDPAHQATAAPVYPRFNHVAQQMSFPTVSIINTNNKHIIIGTYTYERERAHLHVYAQKLIGSTSFRDFKFIF